MNQRINVPILSCFDICLSGTDHGRLWMPWGSRTM